MHIFVAPYQYGLISSTMTSQAPGSGRSLLISAGVTGRVIQVISLGQTYKNGGCKMYQVEIFFFCGRVCVKITDIPLCVIDYSSIACVFSMCLVAYVFCVCRHVN